MLILNGKQVPTELFPNNETKVKDYFEKWLKPKRNVLELKYETDADLILLMFAKCRIDEFNRPVTLFLWYMPYSRMDRPMEDDLYTLPYVCDFINKLSFEKVVVLEPHSSKTVELLENVTDLYIMEEWLPKVKEKIGFDVAIDHIVFPDKGAEERNGKLDCNNIVFQKKRDPVTRQIEKEDMKIIKGSVTSGAKCIIVDDISARATTALLAASILKSLGASMVVLVVAHCEETVFKGNLLSKNSPVDGVYTSKALMSKKHARLHYMKVNVRKYV